MTAAMKQAGTAGSMAGRELVQQRVFDAPRELVWEVFTDPKHVDNWWGPKGFRNTTQAMDVRVGGEWVFVMHGPDGTDYDNKIVYRELVKPERMVYGHGDSHREHFQVTVTFEEKDGKTHLTMHSVFPTVEALERVKSFGAVELGRQTLESLANYLAAARS